jgi:uncharacterized phiE125 gp8 family phage protein
MAINIIHSTKVIDGSNEPISTSEAKLHASIDYSEFDSIIPTYISAARLAVEKATGLALVQKTITSQATIYVEYPLILSYKPVKQVNYIRYLSENECDLYGADAPVVRGAENELVFVKKEGLYEIEYVAGMTSVPADLKLAILQMFAFIFTQRGDYNEGKLDVSLEAERIMGQNQRFFV